MEEDFINNFDVKYPNGIHRNEINELPKEVADLINLYISQGKMESDDGNFFFLSPEMYSTEDRSREIDIDDSDIQIEYPISNNPVYKDFKTLLLAMFLFSLMFIVYRFLIV
jgi:hypothetical protein